MDIEEPARNRPIHNALFTAGVKWIFVAGCLRFSDHTGLFQAFSDIFVVIPNFQLAWCYPPMASACIVRLQLLGNSSRCRRARARVGYRIPAPVRSLLHRRLAPGAQYRYHSRRSHSRLPMHFMRIFSMISKQWLVRFTHQFRAFQLTARFHNSSGWCFSSCNTFSTKSFARINWSSRLYAT